LPRWPSGALRRSRRSTGVCAAPGAFSVFASSPSSSHATRPQNGGGRKGWSGCPSFSPLPPSIGLGYGLVIFVIGTWLALGDQAQGLFVGAGLLTLLVVGRQWVALRENARLNAELRDFSAKIEQRAHEAALLHEMGNLRQTHRARPGGRGGLKSQFQDSKFKLQLSL
jgi:hypothetical protein